MHRILQAARLTSVSFPCNCAKNQGFCKQRVNFLADQIQVIATDVISFVAPAHSQQLYCACALGFSGKNPNKIKPSRWSVFRIVLICENPIVF